MAGPILPASIYVQTLSCARLDHRQVSCAGRRGHWKRLTPRLHFEEVICQATPAPTRALGLSLLDSQASVLRLGLCLVCSNCRINYKVRRKGGDKWEYIMLKYENMQIHGHILRAYGIPGAELGRRATKTNTARFLAKETDV